MRIYDDTGHEMTDRADARNLVQGIVLHRAAGLDDRALEARFRALWLRSNGRWVDIRIDGDLATVRAAGGSN